MDDAKSHKLITMPHLSRAELAVGLIFLAVYVFALPVLIPLVAGTAFPDAGGTLLTAVYYLISFIAILAIFRRFLLLSYRKFIRAPRRALSSLVLAVLIYYLTALAVTFVVSMLKGGANPNDAYVAQGAETGRRAILASAILLGPFVEETLFRGMVFGPLRRKSRVLAYAVSFFVFAFYHLWQYMLSDFSPSLLINLLDYLPAALALGMCYERSGTVWAPMLLHAAINAAALFTL